MGGQLGKVYFPLDSHGAIVGVPDRVERVRRPAEGLRVAVAHDMVDSKAPYPA